MKPLLINVTIPVYNEEKTSVENVGKVVEFPTRMIRLVWVERPTWPVSAATCCRSNVQSPTPWWIYDEFFGKY